MTQKPQYNKALGRIRLFCVYIFILALFFIARPTPMSVSIGFIFVALGEAIRFWAAGHLHKTVELITSGPYRYTRNPLYLGRLLILTGLCTMATLPYPKAFPYANWIVLGLSCAIFFGYYLPRKERVEPERLRKQHGEPYDKYFRAVPALFPALRPYSDGSTSGWSSDNMLRNREQWMVIGLALFTLVLLWRAYSL